MSNAAEWFDDKWAEVDIWLSDPKFYSYVDQHYLPVNEVDKLETIIKLRYQYEREQNESKNQ